jgi:hypothetical protein
MSDGRLGRNGDSEDGMWYGLYMTAISIVHMYVVLQEHRRE